MYGYKLPAIKYQFFISLFVQTQLVSVHASSANGKDRLYCRIHSTEMTHSDL